jgi:hypothetical protein
VVRRIDPEIRVLAGERPGPKRLDLGVELRAHAGDLGLRHPVEPERLHEVIDLLETEVAAYVEAHRTERDDEGHALVVRNGKGRTRNVTIGSGRSP